MVGWLGEPDGNDISRVEASPYFSDAWPAVVHASDCEIVPAATYGVRASLDAIGFTDPLAVPTTPRPGTAWWEDCVGLLDGDTWTPPNGVVSFDDVTAAIQYFMTAATAPHVTVVDIEPQETNAVLNFTDIMQIVLAFQSEPYPFADPGDCP